MPSDISWETSGGGFSAAFYDGPERNNLLVQIFVSDTTDNMGRPVPKNSRPNVEMVEFNVDHARASDFRVIGETLMRVATFIEAIKVAYAYEYPAHTRS